MSRLRATVAAWTLVLASIGGPEQLPAETDSHYLDLLERGSRELRRGASADAARQLRIAAFGLLDEPALLAQALVELAVARGNLEDRDGFLDAFDRIVNVERVAGGYSRAELDPGVRAAFSERAASWVSEELLASSAAFAPLVRRKQMARVEALSPGQRVSELEKLIAAHPADTAWHLLLARELVEAGDGPQATDTLALLQTVLPDDANVACLQERAYLQGRQCASLERLTHCDLLAMPPAELLVMVDCLTTAERWLEAGSLMVSLAPEVRTSRPFARREKRIVAALPEGTEVSRLPRPKMSTERTGPQIVGKPSVSSDPGAPAEQLEAIGSTLELATSRRDLLEVATAAEELAARFPGDVRPRYMAGEAAYRASEWRRAADNLLAEGEPTVDRPDLLFYLSVSLFEMGQPERAEEVLRKALPRLVRTPIVERYLTLILEADRG